MNWTPTTTTTREIAAWRDLHAQAIEARDRATALFNGGDVVSTLRRFGADPKLVEETAQTQAILRQVR
jgi:hypothetical protein